MNRSILPRALLLLLLSLLLLTVESFGQNPSGEAQEKKFLEMRRDRVDLQTERAELARVERLLQQGLVSEAEVERARSKEQKARLDYQEALLDLASVEPRLSVQRAVKLEDDTGRRFVRLTLTNLTSGLGDFDFTTLPEGNDDLLRELAQLEGRPIRNVFVSLKDTGAETPGNPSPLRGATVALPYEHLIPEIGFKETKTLEFQLLRDVASVLVYIAFGGQTQEIDIHLEQAIGERPITVSSSQISQEVDLGSTAVYDLRLQRSAIDEQTFGLRIAGLPPQIRTSFREASGEARLSQLHFPAGVTERNLELRVTLPDRVNEEIEIDEPLVFEAMAFEPGAGEDDEVRTGSVRLELIPRGVGRLDLGAPSLFSEMSADETLETSLRLRNTGSRVVHDVKTTVEPPLRWEAEVEPEILDTLAPGEERQLRLVVRPPAEVPVGDYELRLQAESLASNRAVDAPEKIYRVRIEPKSGLTATALVLFLLLVLTAGIVVFGVRLARR